MAILQAIALGLFVEDLDTFRDFIPALFLAYPDMCGRRKDAVVGQVNRFQFQFYKCRFIGVVVIYPVAAAGAKLCVIPVPAFGSPAPLPEFAIKLDCSGRNYGGNAERTGR